MKRTRKYSLFIAIYSILVSISQANDTVRELPGEHTDFRSLRAMNKLYIDKSDYIKTLLESEDRFFCMCRPARFGKSNFLQMLDSYFRGRKELFAGMAIHEKHDWQTSYPVIHLNFAHMNVKSLEKFTACLNNEIVRIGMIEYNVNMNWKLPLYPAVRQELETLPNSEETKLGQLMGSLTKNWTQEQSVVILIDEYDYPKRRNSHLYQRENFLSRLDSHLEMFLNPFFYELERMKRFIKFLFLTCTTKVSYRFLTKYPETPITVKDITFEDRFSKMLGLTGAEFEHHLKPHLTELTANLPNETFHTLVQKLRKRYNGYCFSRDGINNGSDCRLFNFHSVISFVRDHNPSFLWHPGNFPEYNILNNVTSMTEFDELFDIFSNQSAILTVPRKSLENPFVMIPGRPGELHKTKSRYSMRAFLVLYGYLTFRGYNEQTDEFVVDFPNDEMRDSYRRSLLRYFVGRETSTSDFTNTCKAIHKSMQSGTTESFVELINNELLKPNVGKNNDVHSFYRFSGNRISHVLSACGALFPEAMIVRTFFREIIHRDVDNANSVIGFVEKIVCDVLVVRLLPSQMTYTIKIEVDRSAVSAIDEALKWVNAGNFRNASRDRTFQLMGINFNKEEDLLNDWIRMTYLNGRFMSVRASNSRNAKMYLTYANHLEPYSSLV